MKKKLFIILFFFPFATFSQENRTYFVSGTPFGFEKSMPSKPVIYRYESLNQLDTISVLTNKKDSKLDFLNVYPDFNLLVMNETIFGEDGKTHFTTVDLLHPKEIKCKEISFQEGTIESNFFVFPDCQNYYCLDFVGKRFLGISKDLDEREFLPNDFNYSYIMGESGGAINNVEFLLLYKDNEDNRLHISKGFG